MSNINQSDPSRYSNQYPQQSAKKIGTPSRKQAHTAPDVKPLRPKGRVPLGVIGLGLLGACVIAYGTNLVYSIHKLPPSPEGTWQVENQSDTSHVYNHIAKDYDSRIGWSEFWMGLPFLRRALGKRLKGDVLEVSAGTGRNIKYFPLKQCRSITLVDSSPGMLDQARKRFRQRHPHYKNARFILQEAEAPLPSPSGQGYDIVVQTMGLCSHNSPVRLLENLESLCKKDGGKIILLEHGRSYYDWLNKVLDYAAPKHAETWGCWWNRDIEGLLRKSGLQVGTIKRYYFGTIYWIEATPRQHNQSG